uniref:Vacuolar-sorting protein SNF8 n=1 Tax=Colobus angolensis palliatus TaxID=336983 RepID=A0A2K5IEV2_COLAP
MHRCGVGTGTIATKKFAKAKYKERGTVLAEDQLAQMSKQLGMLKTNLEEFDPEFHVQFQDMCATFRVEPLMLGVGDFYYKLGVHIIEHWIGGPITLEELHQQLLKRRGKFAQEVSQEDLIRAIQKLKALGTGFSITPVSGTYLIQPVPAEFNVDHTMGLQLAGKHGY